MGWDRSSGFGFHVVVRLTFQQRKQQVVDLAHGCLGPGGIDVGHCCVNLALLCGIREADAFLAAYRRCAGDSFRYEVYWDFVAFFHMPLEALSVYSGWSAFGVEGLSEAMMIERADQYLFSLLGRLNGQG